MLPVIVVNLLSGCATANSDPEGLCPPIRTYDKAFQRKLADEIEAAPVDAAFPDALQDYAVLRAQIRQGCK